MSSLSSADVLLIVLALGSFLGCMTAILAAMIWDERRRRISLDRLVAALSILIRDLAEERRRRLAS